MQGKDEHKLATFDISGWQNDFAAGHGTTEICPLAREAKASMD